MSATEIGRQLGLSKPSITHHLHELRQAGLIDESARGAALSLSLSRAAIAQLGDLALHSLFDSLDSGKIARTRRTS
jgi:DNA-binding transcriptional ArsR family regulator